MTETRRRYAHNASQSEDEESLLREYDDKEHPEWKSSQHDDEPEVPALAIVGVLFMSIAFLFGVAYWVVFADPTGGQPLPPNLPCDTVNNGYQCSPELSHTWGQYSPYYKVESELNTVTPVGCEVTLVQLLYRHGARYPTTDKSAKYKATVDKVKAGAKNLTGPYDFLRSYDYSLGAEDLTSLGQQELVNAGIDSFIRYEALSKSSDPFIRAADQERVVVSARKWSDGFHKAKIRSGTDKDAAFPYPILEISEDKTQNNTLSHGLCTTFEGSSTGQAAMAVFAQTFLPAITARLQRDVGLSTIDDQDTLSIMELCPFTTVAETKFSTSAWDSTNPSDNPFCMLFTAAEWEAYDYHQSVGKYYGFGPGAPLGPTQGVGYANEVIARLTASPVQDVTTVNHTLDSNPKTFPLDRQLYADFSHDNDMTAIYSALGLFEGVPELSKQRVMDAEETNGFAASRTVPFAGRLALEKLRCSGAKDEMVRFVANGRTWPLQGCGPDQRGMCTVTDYVDSVAFARQGGKWDQCFKASANSVSDNVETFA